MKIDTNEAGELFKVIEERNLSVSEAINILSNPVQDWIEKDGVIYLPPVMSDGTSGTNWIPRLEVKGHSIQKYAKSILNSKEFKETDGTIYYPALLKGELFSDNKRITKNIRQKAKELNFSTPNPELACLMRERYSDDLLKAMDLDWITIMHETIKDSDGDSVLLSVFRYDNGSWLDAGFGGSGNEWNRSSGFAFVVSQVSKS